MDDFGDILKGGFRDYLDLLAYKETSAIDNKPLRQEVQMVVKSPETGRVSTTGVPSSSTVAGIPAMWIMGGGLVAVALLVLLLRR